MNVKQLDWLGKPRDIKKTLHSVSYTGTGSNGAFLTLGENGELSLSVETDMPYAFIFLHTNEEYIALKTDRIVLKTLKNRIELPLPSQPSALKVIKEGPLLIFHVSGEEILRTEKEAYRGSASIGIITEGCSRAVLEVF